jgi:hypothetical protein
MVFFFFKLNLFKLIYKIIYLFNLFILIYFNFKDQVLTKNLLKKYDFNLYKGFFIGKNGPNLPDFETKKKIQKIYQLFMISFNR